MQINSSKEKLLVDVQVCLFARSVWRLLLLLFWLIISNQLKQSGPFGAHESGYESSPEVRRRGQTAVSSLCLILSSASAASSQQSAVVQREGRHDFWILNESGGICHLCCHLCIYIVVSSLVPSNHQCQKVSLYLFCCSLVPETSRQTPLQTRRHSTITSIGRVIQALA